MTENWFVPAELDSRWGACYRSIENAEVEDEATTIRETLRHWLRDCQSPIEIVMGAALFRVANLRHTWAEDDWKVIPQCRLLGGLYRLDYLVRPWWEPDEGPSVYPIAVECDGHDFHEKTREQASKDKRRDRELTAAGFRIMRFTGSDILSDPIGCAEQIMGVFKREWGDWYAKQLPPGSEGA